MRKSHRSRLHLSCPQVTVFCFLCLALAQPAAASANEPAPDPRFGIVESYVNPAAATEAGAGFSRILLRWDVIQPGGPDDWKPANVPDPTIAAELAAGREIVAVLIGTPGWAAKDGAQGARSVPDMDRWAQFARRIAQHYRGRISHWIIWNEPDVWEPGHPGQTWAGSVEDYARLVKTAYLAIKDANPESHVLLGGMTYFWDWSHGKRRYLDRLLEAIAADPEAESHGFYFDAVVYHLYFNPSQTPQVLAESQATLRKYGLRKQIWLNETNAPPSEDKQELPWSTPGFRISLEEQAAFVIQEFATAFAAGAARVEFYKLRNTAEHPESIEPYGLLRSDDSRRPAFTAYQVATTYLRDFRTATRERNGRVTAVTFDRGTRTTTVLWAEGRGNLRTRVRSIAGQAILVTERGEKRALKPSGGFYTIDLPGAQCLNTPCIIGGAPRLIVEEAPARGRKAFAAATR